MSLNGSMISNLKVQYDDDLGSVEFISFKEYEDSVWIMMRFDS